MVCRYEYVISRVTNRIDLCQQAEGEPSLSCSSRSRSFFETLSRSLRRNIITPGSRLKIQGNIMTITLNNEKKLKVLLVDDDPSFGYLMTQVAKSMGIDLTHKVSLIELGSFAMIKNFDIAMIDFYLENLRGDEIAQYVDTFFNDMPIVIVSAHEFDDKSKSKWPPTVKAFLPKAIGPSQLLKRVVETYDRMNFLKRFTGTGPSPTP